MQLKIIDENSALFKENFELLIQEALNAANPNAQNLSHLLTRPYLLKNLVLDEMGPVAIGAIENFSNAEVRCVRLLTRTYYMERARHVKWWTKVSSGPIVREILPYQVEWAVKNGFDNMFVSMETIKKRKVLESWVSAVNEWFKYTWTVEDGMFFTCKCPVNNDVKCWQNIASLKLSNQLLPLHRVSLESFQQSQQDRSNK